jgi:hypothetical protein
MALPNTGNLSAINSPPPSIYSLDIFSLLRDLHPTSPSVFAISKAQEIRNLVLEGETELAELRNQIMTLKNKESSLQHRIQACQSFLSPIRKLPDDMLLEIFQYLSFIDLYRGSGTMVSVVNMLRDSIGVCHRWNSIIKASKSLWANLCFHDFSEDTEIGKGPIPELVFQDYLARSGSNHLSLMISLRNSIPIGVKALFKEHAERLCSLHLRSNRSAGLDFFSSTIHYPELRSLQLECSTIANATEPPFWSFITAPRLREVKLSRVCVTAMQFSLPWSQIRRISLSSTSIGDVLRICALCPVLMELDIEGDVNENETTSAEIPSVTLHSLQKLCLKTEPLCSCYLPTLSTIDVDPFNLLFKSITCPSLTDLTLQERANSIARSLNLSTKHGKQCDHANWVQMNGPKLNHFLSKCKGLKTLSLFMPDELTEDVVITLLSSIPSLISFSYKQSKDERHITMLSDKIFTRMTAHEFDAEHPNDPTFRLLLPKLTHLDLNLSSTNNISNDTIQKMIKSRWRPAFTEVAEIRFLRMSSRDRFAGLDFCFNVQRELEDLRKAGFVCHVE